MILKWIEQCILVDGKSKTMIYDLGRFTSFYIKDDIKEIKKKVSGLTLLDAKEKLTDEEFEILNELIDSEIFILVPKGCYDNFVPLSIRYETPRLINTGSFHINNDILKCTELFIGLNCYNVTLIADDDTGIEQTLSNYFVETDLMSLDLYLKNTTKEIDYYDALTKKFPILDRIHTIQSSNIKSLDSKFFQPYFSFSMNAFMESQSYNVYFNRRIHIDKDGFVRNAPGTEKSSININNGDINTLIEQIVSDALISKLWCSTKENTQICSNCELRHQCYDTRIPVKDESSGTWVHETECIYNPFLGEWRKKEN